MNQNPQDKIYYKVVTCYLNSAMINYHNLQLNGKYSVHYKVGQFVYPTLKNSKLMVFETFLNAKDFIRKTQLHDIFTCNVLNPGGNYYLSRLWTDHDFKTFWDDYNYCNSTYADFNKLTPPQGTVFCDAVKLLDRIQL